MNKPITLKSASFPILNSSLSVRPSRVLALSPVDGGLDAGGVRLGHGGGVAGALAGALAALAALVRALVVHLGGWKKREREQRT